MSSIGLSGASGTGKTTLAKAFAEISGFEFLHVQTRESFAKLGLDPKKDYDFATRIRAQWQILRDAEKVYAGCKGKFITDRTPLDMIAYMMADVRRENVSAELADLLARYIGDCYQVLNRHFPNVLVVQPGIPMKDEPGRPSGVSYQEHIHMLVMGSVVDERFKGQHYFVPRDYLDLDRRIDCINYALRRAGEKHESFVRAQKEAGVPIILH